MMGVRPPPPLTGANMEISLRLNGQTTRRPKHSPPSSAGVGGLGLAGGNVLWCHLRLLQCSLRLMFDLVLQ